MADLSTRYMGLELTSPLVVASCTLTADPDKAAALEAAGAGALVMKSIFEEQVRADVADMYEDLDTLMHPEAFEYLSADLPMQLGPEKYLQRLAEVKAAIGVPLIASINCNMRTRWISFAERIQGAGADAIELNIYDIPDNPDEAGAEVERKHLDLVMAVKKAVSIPVAIKIGPYYSSLLHFARRLARVEVDAIVLFNRFFQPDIDVDSLKLKTGINFSRPEDIRVPLRWVAMLRDHVSCDLALSTGVHDGEAAVKAILAGANVVQVCSALYQNGVEHLSVIRDGLAAWMDEKGYATVDDFRGLMRAKNLGDNRGFERAQYIKALVGLE